MEQKDKQDLIERYVYDVTRRLPEKMRKDIGAELRGLIEDMAEEQDIEEVLRELGDPARLAREYRGDSGSLISGEYYDAYWFLMKIVLICTAAGLLLSGILSTIVRVVESISELPATGGGLVDGIFRAFSRANFGEMLVRQLVGHAFGPGIIGVLLMVFAVITIVFIILEKNRVHINFGTEDPLDLFRSGKNGKPPHTDSSGQQNNHGQTVHSNQANATGASNQTAGTNWGGYSNQTTGSARSGKAGNSAAAWDIGNLPPVPQGKKVISKGSMIGEIVFAMIVVVIYVTAPQWMGVWIIDGSGDGMITTIPIFNMAVWGQVLPLMLTASFLGIINSIVKLVERCYNIPVMVTTVITNALSYIICVAVFKGYPIWNPNFRPMMEQAFQREFNGAADIITHWNTALISDLVLLCLALAFVIDTVTVVWRTLQK